MTGRTRALFLGITAATVLGTAAVRDARAQTLDGITVIDLSDESGEDAIRGWADHGPNDSGRYIVSFVSAAGSYAALVGERGGRSCVAWVVPGSYTGKTITFGLPASTATQKAAFPKVCQPFTLRLEGANRVRISAANPFADWKGPLDSGAQTTSYDRQRPILAHIPLVAFDWGAPPFQRHRVNGVPLGPMTAVRAAVGGQAQISLTGLNSALGRGKTFEARFPVKAPQRTFERIDGYVVAKETTGWPWDVLYAIHHAVRFPQSGPGSAFEDAVVQRHGVPSALSFAGSGELAPYQPPSGADRAKVQALPAFYWLYDLAGHKLTPDMAAPNNCLTTASHWLFKELSSINADIGPWGCGLVVVIHGDGDRNAVGGYRIEMVSGYTEALNHFANRLKEMNALKKKVGQMQTYKPKL